MEADLEVSEESIEAVVAFGKSQKEIDDEIKKRKEKQVVFNYYL